MHCILFQTNWVALFCQTICRLLRTTLVAFIVLLDHSQIIPNNIGSTNLPDDLQINPNNIGNTVLPEHSQITPNTGCNVLPVTLPLTQPNIADKILDPGSTSVGATTRLIRASFTPFCCYYRRLSCFFACRATNLLLFLLGAFSPPGLGLFLQPTAVKWNRKFWSFGFSFGFENIFHCSHCSHPYCSHQIRILIILVHTRTYPISFFSALALAYHTHASPYDPASHQVANHHLPLGPCVGKTVQLFLKEEVWVVFNPHKARRVNADFLPGD